MIATAAVAVSALPALAETPSAEELLERVLAAHGGGQRFAQLGLLYLEMTEEETRANGSTSGDQSRAYISTVDLAHMRLEMGNGLTLVRDGSDGWATMKGVLDDRPQTPRMARGTVHQRLFPLLLPFSLTIRGIHIGPPAGVTFDGVPAWRVELELPRAFFANPVISLHWVLYVSRADNRLLAAEYQPPPEYTKVAKEGVRYRIMDTQTVNGITLPSRLLVEGLNLDGSLTGHFRVVTVKGEGRPWDSTLFLHPQKLEALEAGEFD